MAEESHPSLRGDCFKDSRALSRGAMDSSTASPPNKGYGLPTGPGAATGSCDLDSISPLSAMGKGEGRVARGYPPHWPGFGVDLCGSLPGESTPAPKPEGLLRVGLHPQSHIQPDGPPPAWRPLRSVFPRLNLTQASSGPIHTHAHTHTPQPRHTHTPTEPHPVRTHAQVKVTDQGWCVRSFLHSFF